MLKLCLKRGNDSINYIYQGIKFDEHALSKATRSLFWKPDRISNAVIFYPTGNSLSTAKDDCAEIIQMGF